MDSLLRQQQRISYLWAKPWPHRLIYPAASSPTALGWEVIRSSGASTGERRRKKTEEGRGEGEERGKGGEGGEKGKVDLSKGGTHAATRAFARRCCWMRGTNIRNDSGEPLRLGRAGPVLS